MKKMICVLVAVVGSSAHAASLYVDTGGVCANLTPCYSTIQSAVNDAMPNDEIRVFPGVYQESVNLSGMGTSLPQPQEGNIGFVSVDANDALSVGTATVDGQAGPAFTHLGNVFNGGFSLVGFITQSTNDDAIDLDAIAGDIMLNHVTADNAPEDGIDVEVVAGGHDITILNTQANGNTKAGFNLDGLAGTTVTIDAVVASGNGDEGLRIDTNGSNIDMTVSINNTQVNNNGVVSGDSAGADISTSGAVDISHMEAKENPGEGLVVELATNTTIRHSLFEGNGIPTNFEGVYLVVGGAVQLSHLDVIDNAIAGVGIVATPENNDNTSIDISCSQFTNNDFGVILSNDLTDNTSVQINNNNWRDSATAALHAGLNATVDASNNWWNDASGPNHPSSMGTGEAISDQANDLLGQGGGSAGVVGFTPFATSPIDQLNVAADALFIDGFESGACAQWTE